MPVYSWKGLDAHGVVQQGTQCAPSYEQLRADLYERHIGLLQATAFLNIRAPSVATKQFFFSQLASLLQSHIPLHTALTLIAASVKQIALKAIIEDVARHISQGAPLSEALHRHSLSDDLSHSVIMMSEKTGSLALSLHMLVEHTTFIDTFRKKMRAALLGPIITLLFFTFVMMVILILVIPQFETYFLSYNLSLSGMTAFVFSLSRFIRSLQAVYALIIIAVIVGSFKLFFQTASGSSFKDRIQCSLPVIAYWLERQYQARLLKMMGMLLEQGIPLREAFDICINTVNQRVIKKELLAMKESVMAGISLSSAWKQSWLASDDIHPFLIMGEASGDLGRMMTVAGDRLLEKIYRSLHSISALMQPLFMLVLGMLVSGLLIAVYMPLLTFSQLLM